MLTCNILGAGEQEGRLCCLPVLAFHVELSNALPKFETFQRMSNCLWKVPTSVINGSVSAPGVPLCFLKLGDRHRLEGSDGRSSTARASGRALVLFTAGVWEAGQPNRCVLLMLSSTPKALFHCISALQTLRASWITVESVYVALRMAHCTS